MENLTADIYLDPSVRCLFTRASGTLTRENCFDLADLTRQDNRYENDFNILLCIMDCTVEISPEGLRQLAIYIDQKWPTKKSFTSAYIVDGPLNYGLARIYGAYSSNRVHEPSVLNGKQPHIVNQIKTLFNLPADYQLPDFLNF